MQFSHVRVFSDSRNVQKHATKSDTSGHCLALSVKKLSWIFSVVILRWQGYTLNMNTLTSTVWSTWGRARGSHSATCAGLAHVRDYGASDCRASEEMSQKCLAHADLDASDV